MKGPPIVAAIGSFAPVVEAALARAGYPPVRAGKESIRTAPFLTARLRKPA